MGANPYAFDGFGKANADALNAVTADIHARLLAAEALAPSIEAAKDSLVAIGLQRMNAELLPVILEEQARVQRGVMIAGSTTPASLVVGATLNLTVDPADRLSFSPSAFVMLTRTTSLHDFAALQTTNWDTGTGIYTGTIVAMVGDPGPWADWELGSQAGSTLAQRTLLAEGQAAAQATLDDAAAARADRALADADAAAAAASATAAGASASAAAASAAAANRIGAGLMFTAASTTRAAIALGSVAVVLTAETAAEFAPMARLALISASNPLLALAGNLQSYDPSSGTLTILVDQASGSGSASDWIVTPALPAFVPAIIDGGDDDTIGAPPPYQSSYVPGDLASLAAFVASPAFTATLPTSLPSTPGTVWNDNGVMAITQP